MLYRLTLALAIAMTASIAKAADPVLLYAAGSLRAALSEVSQAVDELKLAKGQTAYAVIKGSDVMVAVD